MDDLSSDMDTLSILEPFDKKPIMFNCESVNSQSLSLISVNVLFFKFLCTMVSTVPSEKYKFGLLKPPYEYLKIPPVQEKSGLSELPNLVAPLLFGLILVINFCPICISLNDIFVNYIVIDAL